MIDAEIYGMMLRAKIAMRPKAPPASPLTQPRIPVEFCAAKRDAATAAKDKKSGKAPKAEAEQPAEGEAKAAKPAKAKAEAAPEAAAKAPKKAKADEAEDKKPKAKPQADKKDKS